MPSKAEIAIFDVVHHGDLAIAFTAGFTYEQFAADTKTVFAVLRCLEVISEASRRWSPEVKSRHPAIASQEMAAAGNVYRHEYEDVAAHRVWITLREALPPLLSAMKAEAETI